MSSAALGRPTHHLMHDVPFSVKPLPSSSGQCFRFIKPALFRQFGFLLFLSHGSHKVVVGRQHLGLLPCLPPPIRLAVVSLFQERELQTLVVEVVLVFVLLSPFELSGFRHLPPRCVGSQLVRRADADAVAVPKAVDLVPDAAIGFRQLLHVSGAAILVFPFQQDWHAGLRHCHWRHCHCSFCLFLMSRLQGCISHRRPFSGLCLCDTGASFPDCQIRWSCFNAREV